MQSTYPTLQTSSLAPNGVFQLICQICWWYAFGGISPTKQSLSEALNKTIKSNFSPSINLSNQWFVSAAFVNNCNHWSLAQTRLDNCCLFAKHSLAIQPFNFAPNGFCWRRKNCPTLSVLVIKFISIIAIWVWSNQTPSAPLWTGKPLNDIFMEGCQLVVAPIRLRSKYQSGSVGPC